MSLWVLVTLGAALVQSLRFMLQKQLKGAGLSTGGATFSRFLFGAPLAALAAVATFSATGTELPLPGARFWAFALTGGAAQVAATFLTVALFSLRNFAVGVAFTKTETVQVAAFSALVLGEAISPTGWVAIGVGFLGLLALTHRPGGGGIFSRAALYGVLAGMLFGISAIGYRGATQELLPLSSFSRAIFTLACVTFAQSLGMALYLRAREPGELGRVVRAWQRTIWVGVAGVVGSAGWFTAFALQNAAYVRALGQVEIVFTLAISAVVFHERLRPREGLGIALVVVSLIGIVLGARGA
ncbi:EamA family transporter [Phaeovulum sp.]|uniref:EamA family transporter n=1 Tax=Phaeovulum sp. TaxID=2934796 RepID=UPI0035613BEB